MKFIAVGDLHGDRELARQIKKTAIDNKVDFIIFTGDLSHFDENAEFVANEFKNLNIKKYFIPGNHDSEITAEMLYRIFNFKPFHNGYFLKYDFAFVGFGFASVGPFSKSTDHFYDSLNKIISKLKNKGLENIILVTHEHPKETSIEKFTSFFEGNPAITAIIKKFQPMLHICSHVHEAGNMFDYLGKTKIVNVARIPKVFEF